MRRLAVLLLVLLASPAMAAAPPENGGCGIPVGYVTAPKPLTALKAAIAAHRPIDILAVGSGATTGGGSVRPGQVYPVHTIDALRVALPQDAVTLTVRGGRGMTAVEMLPLVEAEVKQTPPTVVLWQTGTVEAIKAMRPDRMRQALRAGLEAIHAAGGDLVVIDPLFTRAMRANADVEPYEAELQSVGAMAGAALFRRLELTRTWALDGSIDPEGAPEAKREAVVTRLNACVGEALARFLLNGAEAPP